MFECSLPPLLKRAWVATLYVVGRADTSMIGWNSGCFWPISEILDSYMPFSAWSISPYIDWVQQGQVGTGTLWQGSYPDLTPQRNPCVWPEAFTEHHSHPWSATLAAEGCIKVDDIYDMKAMIITVSLVRSMINVDSLHQKANILFAIYDL